jgi:hypothetical protein
MCLGVSRNRDAGMRNEVEEGFLERTTLYAGAGNVVRVAGCVGDGTGRRPALEVTVGLHDEIYSLQC